jgi:predicted DCC family thiol-disulfide oxidoreductase YuxK
VNNLPLTVLYDGECPFCTASAENLARRLGPARVRVRDFQQPGVLEEYPSVRREAAMLRMHVVLPDGRIYAGAEAAARIARTLRVIGWLGALYYVPGLRQLSDAAYLAIARNRYRLFGKRVRAAKGADANGAACEGGTCHLHGF